MITGPDGSGWLEAIRGTIMGMNMRSGRHPGAYSRVDIICVRHGEILHSDQVRR